MLSDAGYNSKPVAFVDDDPVKRKMKIHGIPVVGRIADIKAAADRVGAHEIIVAIPSASTEVKQKILAASEGCTAPIKILPNVKRLLGDPVSLQQVRPMSLEDLLQREPIQTDRQELHPLIEGKTVLVTGAGGSIGSELCRQIARYKPESLVLFEQYENSLHALLLELRALFPHVGVLPVVGDVTMPDRVGEVFRQTGPDLVFHAAAHKHVPLMELNPKEAIRNNIVGTRVVAEAALKTGVDRFILISTDKAVNPSSVMGVTKRIAEHLVQGFSHKGLTKFTVVRFGNVLGSNGSVVPLFADQIRKGGPVTVTDPEIKRFFMTIPEAVQLVLQSSLMGQGGDVFVLDMGEQIKVADLARNMIVLSGLVPGKDIEIAYTGLRPGEKLYEELFEGSEQVESTSHPKINRAVGGPVPVGDLDRWIEGLQVSLPGSDEEELLQDLKRLVPSFHPAVSQDVSQRTIS
jgi:FlaA1/EpsC-like NDP-sugar epimerase